MNCLQYIQRKQKEIIKKRNCIKNIHGKMGKDVEVKRK